MKILNNKASLIIYGCGGHARSVADVALFNGKKQLIFVDEKARDQEKCFGFDVLQTFDAHHHESIVAIGDNQKRAALFATLNKNTIPALIAQDAYVSAYAHIAAGVFVGHGAHIGPNAMIDENTIINTQCIVEHDCKIGKHCHISVNAVMAGRSSVGDFVMVGAGATVIDNVAICADVTIGAGAVVVKDITEPGTYVGVPARKV